MIGFLKLIILNFTVLVSKMYRYGLHIRFCVLRDEVYSTWIKSVLGLKGNNIVIRKGTKLDGAKYMTIGNNVTIGRNCLIETKYAHGGRTYSPQLTIGDGSYIGDENHITCMGNISIGPNLLTGRRVLISDNNHGSVDLQDLTTPPGQRHLYSKGKIQIGKNVWIGENACILSGVTIGDGVVIAANAVVTHDIPAFSLAAGVPAKIIKAFK